MSYVKILQYANVTEVYEYEKTVKRDTPAARKARLKKMDDRLYYAVYGTRDVVADRRRLRRVQLKEKGLYKRTKRSIKRSTDNFFRLVHHNVYDSKTIHFLTLTFAYDISYKEALKAQWQFFKRLKEADSAAVSVRYISAPRS